jgi:hypothetical protein
MSTFKQNRIPMLNKYGAIFTCGGFSGAFIGYFVTGKRFVRERLDRQHWRAAAAAAAAGFRETTKKQ